ncbi:MAG: hypothetical protein WA151_07145, partial [Desulfatirhabdiaceae bacterium]
TIYWKTKEAQWPSGSPYLCHCYYFTKDIGSAGYLPNIQYTGLVGPPDKLTFGEAAALTPFYASHDREVCPSAECNGGGATNSNGSQPRKDAYSGVVVTSITSPDPRRVGQRYTFTLSIENHGKDTIRVSSVSARTTVNGRSIGGSGKNYFSPQNHSGRGWLTSVAPSGRETVIYQGTGTATADSVGLWETELTFHTDHGDYTINTSSQVRQ